MAKGKGRNKGFSMGGGGGQAGMMQQLQQMQQQLADAQEKLAIETVTATAGGGAISVTMTGDQKCTEVKIAPDFLEDIDAINIGKAMGEKLLSLAGKEFKRK